MNLEQLTAMSDDELNELSAVKVMGYKVVGSGVNMKFKKTAFDGYYTLWNPCSDMNDCYELFQVMIKDNRYSDATITYPYCIVAGYGVNQDSCELNWSIHVEDDSLPRAITIASILAKGSE